MQLLIENVSDVDASKYEGISILLTAMNGHMVIVQSRIQREADVNTEDYYGRRALRWVAKYGNETMVRLLVGKEATISAEDHWGRTALI